MREIRKEPIGNNKLLKTGVAMMTVGFLAFSHGYREIHQAQDELMTAVTQLDVRLSNDPHFTFSDSQAEKLESDLYDLKSLFDGYYDDNGEEHGLEEEFEAIYAGQRKIKLALQFMGFSFLPVAVGLATLRRKTPNPPNKRGRR